MVGTRKRRGTGGSGEALGSFCGAWLASQRLICIPSAQFSTAEAERKRGQACVICKLKCGHVEGARHTRHTRGER